MSRKLFAILMALVIAASLVACNGDENEGTTGEKVNTPTETGTEATTNDAETGEEGSEIGTGAPVDSSVPGELDYVESHGTVYILHRNGAVNLRKADGTVFKSFNNGTELQKIAISENGEWTKVVYEEETYYIISSGVSALANLDAGFEEKELTLVIAADSLKIRIAPDFENTHEAIGYYQKGDEVKVIAVNTTNPDEPWYKVEFVAYGGETATGYVSAASKYYVQEETEADTTVDTEATTEATTESAGK